MAQLDADEDLIQTCYMVIAEAGKYEMAEGLRTFIIRQQQQMAAIRDQAMHSHHDDLAAYCKLKSDTTERLHALMQSANRVNAQLVEEIREVYKATVDQNDI